MPTLGKIEAGALIRARREALGLTQDQVAEQVGIPTITQLSEYENGKVSIARSKYFPVLAGVLRLTEEEIRQINPSAVFAPTPRSGPPVAPIVEPVAYQHPIPEALQIVADNYGDQFPELRDAALLRAMIPPRMFDGDGPETAEQWLEWFLMNRKWWKGN